MNIWIRLGAIGGGLSVLLGAFGAHSLKKVLTPKDLDTFQTATQYLTIHSIALIIVGILAIQVGEEQSKKLNRAGKFFIAGILMFCGSLYALAFDGPRFFGPITPLGGLCFIIAWLMLAFSISKNNNN
jgi:uncharacterized membrane protein YgdD (TMEM256/DUF423 family)